MYGSDVKCERLHVSPCQNSGDSAVANCGVTGSNHSDKTLNTSV